jgi:hypothetical protein
VIVAVTCALVKLIAVKEAIFPVPVAVNPIDGLLFVQLNEVPVIAPENVIGFVVAPLHNT